MAEIPEADLPVWTFRPNWAEKVRETLAWMTDVLRSDLSGATQTRGLRIGPRRSFEFAPSLWESDRTYFDLSINAYGGGEWLLPLWHDGARLTAPLEATDTIISCNTVGREFVAGEYALVMDRSARTFARVLIDAVSDDTLLLDAAYTGPDWISARVYPLKRAYLEQQPTLSRVTSRVGTSSLRFTQSRPVDRTPVLALNDYLGYPVMPFRPNEIEDLDYDFERSLSVFDSDTGRRVAYDPAGQAEVGQAFRWYMRDRADRSDFRDLMHILRGKHKSIWVPSFNDDLILAEPATASTSIVVRHVGLSMTGVPFEGREDVRILRRDGTVLMRRIVSVADNLDDTETVTLNAAVTLTLADTRQISFAGLCRQGSDSVEIEHEADEDGAATATTTYRRYANVRDADENNLDAIPMGETCDACTPLTLIPSVPEEVWQAGIRLANDEEPTLDYISNASELVATFDRIGRLMFSGTCLGDYESLPTIPGGGASNGVVDYAAGEHPYRDWVQSLSATSLETNETTDIDVNPAPGTTIARTGGAKKYLFDGFNPFWFIDPATRDLWTEDAVYNGGGTRYRIVQVFRFADDYKLFEYPLVTAATGSTSVEFNQKLRIIGFTSDHAIVRHYEEAGPVYTYAFIEKNYVHRDVATGIDPFFGDGEGHMAPVTMYETPLVLGSYDATGTGYSGASQCDINTVCFSQDDRCWILADVHENSGYGGRHYALWTLTESGGFDEVTPWTAGAGPDAPAAAWAEPNYTYMRYRNLFTFMVHSSDTLVAFTAGTIDDFLIDICITYIDTSDLSYTSHTIGCYLDADFNFCAEGSAVYKIVKGTVEMFDRDRDYTSFVHEDASAVRYFTFTVVLMDDSASYGVIAGYEFTPGAAPVCVDSLRDDTLGYALGDVTEGLTDLWPTMHGNQIKNWTRDEAGNQFVHTATDNSSITTVLDPDSDPDKYETNGGNSGWTLIQKCAP